MLTKLIAIIISQYICQTIRLYTLNLYSNVCQLYLNKTGEEKSLHLTQPSKGK